MNYYYDYLSAEDFDLMTDEEIDNWLEQKAAYEEGLAAGK